MIASISFLITSALLGAGLAMDAFSVSVANAMRDPGMKRGEMARIAGAFALFQFLMPEIGWICVHTLLTVFESFQICIPWIALFLLAFIGGKMLLEGIQERKLATKEKEAIKDNSETDGINVNVVDTMAVKESGKVPERRTAVKALPLHTLILQAVATSIDALSVGFAIAEYSVMEALLAGLIIAVVTFCICIGGILIGKKTGDLIGGNASILGGVILIAIGIEIWVTGIF